LSNTLSIFRIIRSAHWMAAATSDSVRAVPITLQSTGTRTFCSVEDNVVRFLANSAAVPAYAACQGYAALAN